MIHIDRAYRRSLLLSGLIVVGLILAGFAGEEGLGVWLLTMVVPMLIIAPLPLLFLGVMSGLASWKAWRIHRFCPMLVLTILSLFVVISPIASLLVTVTLDTTADVPFEFLGYALVVQPLFAVPAALYWYWRRRPPKTGS